MRVILLSFIPYNFKFLTCYDFLVLYCNIFASNNRLFLIRKQNFSAMELSFNDYHILNVNIFDTIYQYQLHSLGVFGWP